MLGHQVKGFESILVRFVSAVDEVLFTVDSNDRQVAWESLVSRDPKRHSTRSLTQKLQLPRNINSSVSIGNEFQVFGLNTFDSINDDSVSLDNNIKNISSGVDLRNHWQSLDDGPGNIGLGIFDYSDTYSSRRELDMQQ